MPKTMLERGKPAELKEIFDGFFSSADSFASWDLSVWGGVAERYEDCWMIHYPVLSMWGGTRFVYDSLGY